MTAEHSTELPAAGLGTSALAPHFDRIRHTARGRGSGRQPREAPAVVRDAELLSQQAHDAAGKPSAAVSADYNQATRLMQGDILPAVRNLTSSSESGVHRGDRQQVLCPVHARAHGPVRLVHIHPGAEHGQGGQQRRERR
jgi:hypothetical protein